MPQRVPPSAAWTLDPPQAPARNPEHAARLLKAAAHELGFEPVGIAPTRLPEPERQRLHTWLERCHHGTMKWLAREPDDRTDASTLLENARSILMVGLNYPARAELPTNDAAIVSTYAQAPYDYHKVLAIRLTLLERYWSALMPGASARRFCDTSPLLERPFGFLAGLGFVGKNTNLINRERGSYFFLGGLILDHELPVDEPDLVGSCGTCTLCLEACPTDAFPEPWVLDSRRCISYLTIEHRGAWDEGLREGVGTHVFGCDICQVVCPWNAKFAAPPDAELEADPERRDPPLLTLVRRAQASFKSLARGTPWARTGKRGFIRNLVTAMGNTSDPRYRAALEELALHEDPGVAEHARWARDRC